jgi:hypothetical protein
VERVEVLRAPRPERESVGDDLGDQRALRVTYGQLCPGASSITCVARPRRSM